MKRYFYILCLLIFASNLNAQNPLEKTLNFRVKEQPIEKVLYTLIDEAKVNITFSNDILPKDKLVSIRVKRKTVEYILKEILKDSGLKFILRPAPDGQILIVKKPLLPNIPIRKKATISGYLLDSDSGEPLIGATLQDLESRKGTYSNAYGFFSLTLPVGQHKLQASYLGYEVFRDTIELTSSISKNFELDIAITLEEVIVYSSGDTPDMTVEILGTEEFSIREDKSATGVGGENDLIKKVHQMTGVQTGADGFGGFTVRGGNVDQNLVLLDGVPVYNSLHALGLYSIFDENTVSSSQLIKGVFPARYGGRVSSVIDVRTKEGNNRRLSGKTEFGPLSGSVLLEGPLKKEKSSFLISFRRSFIDWYSRPFYRGARKEENITGELSYYFYDINAKINQKLSKNDKVYFSFYSGRDIFDDEYIINNVRLNVLAPDPSVPDTIIREISFSQVQNWGNVIASNRWNHVFSNKLFSNTTLTYTRFFFENKEPRSQTTSFGDDKTESSYRINRFNSNNQDIAAKIDFDYHPSNAHHLLFGANFTAHKFQPYIINITGNIPLDTFNFYLSDNLERGGLNSYEYEAYVEDEYQVNKRLNINPGFRFTAAQTPDKTYFYPQPRLSISFEAAEEFYIQGAVGYVVQPLHLLTTTGRGRAEDLWVPATSRFEPIESWQYVAGIEFNPGDFWTLSVEGYYKNLKNIISFQEGQIENIDADSWQDNTVVGTGKASGLEFSFNKTQGKTTARFAYTLAYSTRNFEDKNNGNSYRSQFDRRHNFNLGFNQKIGKRLDINATFIFQSGALTTVPQASYYFTVPSLVLPYQGPAVVYSGLNNVSLPNYHRLDLGANYRWSRIHRKIKNKKEEISFEKINTPIKQTIKIGVYNIYNRQNPSYYSVSNDCENSDICTKQVTLVPILPFIRYGIKF